MQIAARTAAWLPYDAEVEWIESDGNQVINIDYQIAIGDEVRIKYIPNDNRQIYCIWSNRPYSDDASKNSYSCFALTTGVRFDYRNGTSGTLSTGTLPPIEEIAEFVAVREKLYYNGRLLITAPILPHYDVIGDLCLFASSGGAGVFGNYAKIKLMSFSVGNSLDLIPVRVGPRENCVGYMYDRVSGNLYGNAGTGAFAVGPDKT